MYAKVSNGYLFITTNGGNGNIGQDGADGRKGTDDDSTVCEPVDCHTNNKMYLKLNSLYLLQTVSVSATVAQLYL